MFRWRRSSLSLLGAAMVGCWWRIRALGDVRLELGAFYGWFAAAFALYLATLWCVHRWEKNRTLLFSRNHGLDNRHVPIVPLLLILVFGGVARLMLLDTTPTLSDDIYRYRWDGRVQLAGIDPYAYPPNAVEVSSLQDAQSALINFPHLRTVYPPLTQLAFRVGASLGGTITTHKAVFVACELLIAASLLVILWCRKRSLLWVAAYAWHPLVVLEVAGSGHNDTLGIAALWLGLAAWEGRRSDHHRGGRGVPDAVSDRRWFGLTLAWSAGFLAKFGTFVMLPWWWCRRAGRGWLVACVVLAMASIACYPSAVSALVESLGAMTTRVQSNSSVFLLLSWVVGSAGAARILVSVAGGLFLLWWARRQADPIAYLLGGLSVVALLSPVLHPWYLLWIVPCFCVYRFPPMIALTGTVVLAYTIWPGQLESGRWAMPVWAHVLEYLPVVLFGLWEGVRFASRSSFLHATKPPLLAKS